MSRTSDEILLLPTPRRLERLKGFVEIPRGDLPVTIDDIALAKRMIPCRRAADGEPALVSVAWQVDSDPLPATPDDQRYALQIQNTGGRSGGNSAPIMIRAATRAGARHALATLAQLLRQFPRRLPCLSIDDRPSFAVRGVMLDVSRDRVPTMKHFRETIDTLAGLKCNHLQLYTEHTFAYAKVAGADAEPVWHGCSPLTPDEVRTLDAYCRERGIELSANQNCFGHLHRWLSQPPYRHLAETHADWMFDLWPRSGAFSLAPGEPGSIEFVRDMLGQLLPCFESKLVNIGCDETFDIGWGKSKALVEKHGGGTRGRAAVYLEFVSKICDVVRSMKRRPAFWADIALRDPECVPDIPQDLLALAWGYEPDSPFEDWCRVLGEAKREVWVCPGTSSWRSIYGRTTERRGNLRAAASAGVKHGATGFLMTDWGDTGHHQQWPVSLHALGHGAQAAWNAEKVDEFDGRTASLHLFGDADLRVGPWLEKLGDADLALRQVTLGLSRPGVPGVLKNSSAIFADMHNMKWGDGLDVGPLKKWEEAAKRIAELAEQTPRGLTGVLDAQLRHTATVARFAAVRAATRRRKGGGEASLRKKLADRLHEIIAEHRELWLLQSREGGLEHSCGFYEKVLKDMASQ